MRVRPASPNDWRTVCLSSTDRSIDCWQATPSPNAIIARSCSGVRSSLSTTSSVSSAWVGENVGTTGGRRSAHSAADVPIGGTTKMPSEANAWQTGHSNAGSSNRPLAPAS
eukprot:scaffold33937_cov30-Tisochrysis_lutea.AAC.2